MDRTELVSEQRLLLFTIKLIDSYVHSNPSVLLHTYELRKGNHTKKDQNFTVQYLRTKVEDLQKQNPCLKMSDILSGRISGSPEPSSNFYLFKPQISTHPGRYPSSIKQDNCINFKKGIIGCIDYSYDTLIKQADPLEKTKLINEAEQTRLNFTNKLNHHIHALKGNVDDFAFGTFTHGNKFKTNIKLFDFDLEGKNRIQYFSNDIVRVVFGDTMRCQIHKIGKFNYYTFSLPHSYHPGSWIFQQCNINNKTNLTFDLLNEAFAFLVLDLYQKQSALNVINDALEQAHKLPSSTNNLFVSTLIDEAKDD